MYNRYSQQRKPNAIQEAVQTTFTDPMLAESLLDRSQPLPDWMSQNLEKCLEEYKLYLLGCYDDVYGLSGNMPNRRRW